MTGARAAWSVYWTTDGDGGCLTRAPPPVLAALRHAWSEVAAALPPGARVLDLAAGSGAVLCQLRTARPDLTLGGIDYADVGPAARALGITGGIDAAALPFPDRSRDAVVSQFGIEYCPAGALAEAARVVVPGGRLAFVCHHAASEAVTHNRSRLAAMQALTDAGLFSLAAEVALGGPEDIRAERVNAARAAHPAQGIATELPMALGQALARSDRVARVAAITGMAGAEMTRLRAMTAAALDTAAAATMVDCLGRAGVSATARVLGAAATPRFAWRIEGIRH